MRINQFIAHNSKFSRRQADSLIKQNRVKIEHKIAILSDNINVGDKRKVFVDGKEIRVNLFAKFSVICYHKPKGEIVSKKDDRNRRVIYDGLEARFRHFVPIGRLDFASSGLLLLSDSPKVARALMESSLTRIYILKLDKKINPNIIEAMENGLMLENARAGGHKNSKIVSMNFAPFEFCEILKEGKPNSAFGDKIKVGINEGQNRELRRFFAHFGIKILDLVRVGYGFIHLNALPCGKTRFLNKDEYKKLHKFLGEKNANTNEGR